MLALLIHYFVYVFLVFTAKPENQVSYGMHETIGPCQETTPVYTAFGHVSHKKTIFFYFACNTGSFNEI